jgi:hypothetical protein
LECLNPLRISRQNEEQKIIDERDKKKSKQGAFTFSNGGAY